MTCEDKRALMEAVTALVLWLVCLLAPWLVFHSYGPLWGLGSAVAAFGLYAWVGPRPFPGFLPGIMSIWILFGSLGCVAVAAAVLLKHALHRGH